MEEATLLLDELKITQGYDESYSHKGRYALDIVGSKTGKINLKAPFDGIIKKVYTKSSNVVWLESINKVKYASGVSDYMTIMTMHDNDVSDLKVGKKIKKGEVYYTGGTKGNVTGAHIHIEVGKGKFSGGGWSKNSYGKWTINNKIKVHEALFISDNCKIINDYKYAWKKAGDRSINKVKGLQEALNKSYKTKLNTNIYDSATKRVIAKHNLKYKNPVIKNDFVKWVQTELNNNGYKITIDSKYGPKTKEMVKKFQKDNKLKVDGIVGNSVVKYLLN